MMAGLTPPPTALMPQRVELSTKLVIGYPQLSVVAVAGGIVIPGVHDAAPELALQLDPMLPPPVDVQFEPLQQRFGRGAGCGVHVRLAAQPPVESQRHPCVPTMHVVGAPEPELVPPPSAPKPPPSSPSRPPSPPAAPPSPPPVAVPPPPQAVTPVTKVRTPSSACDLIAAGKRRRNIGISLAGAACSASTGVRKACCVPGRRRACSTESPQKAMCLARTSVSSVSYWSVFTGSVGVAGASAHWSGPPAPLP